MCVALLGVCAFVGVRGFYAVRRLLVIFSRFPCSVLFGSLLSGGAKPYVRTSNIDARRYVVSRDYFRLEASTCEIRHVQPDAGERDGQSIQICFPWCSLIYVVRRPKLSLLRSHAAKEWTRKNKLPKDAGKQQ